MRHGVTVHRLHHPHSVCLCRRQWRLPRFQATSRACPCCSARQCLCLLQAQHRSSRTRVNPRHPLVSQCLRQQTPHRCPFPTALQFCSPRPPLRHQSAHRYCWLRLLPLLLLNECLGCRRKHYHRQLTGRPPHPIASRRCRWVGSRCRPRRARECRPLQRRTYCAIQIIPLRAFRCLRLANLLRRWPTPRRRRTSSPPSQSRIWH